MNESPVEYFIYPLSRESGYTFDEGADIAPENFWADALKGETSHWGLSNGFRLVEPGDWVWAYFGGSVRRICGVGTIRGPVEWHPNWERHSVRIKWDKKVTARLKTDPIHYDDYRQQVQSAVVRANQSTRRVLDRWLRRTSPGATKAARSVKFAERAVTQRLGQAQFRAEVLRAYGGACSITACTEASVLQAGHITPVAGGGSHAVANSILLRADLHNLFDLGKITVTSDLKVRVSDDITDSTYRDLNGRAVRRPAGVTRAEFAKAFGSHRSSHFA